MFRSRETHSFGAKGVLKRFVECDTTWEEVGRRREEGFRLNPELRRLHS